jgi:hypothetical protein
MLAWKGILRLRECPGMVDYGLIHEMETLKYMVDVQVSACHVRCILGDMWQHFNMVSCTTHHIHGTNSR